MKKMLVLLVTALVVACATPEGMRRVATSDKVVFDLPTEGLAEGGIHGINFEVRPYECTRAGYRYLRDTKLARQGEDRCTVNFMTFIMAANGARTTKQIAYDNYLFEIKKSSEKAFTRVEFKPLFEGIPPYRNFGSKNISPPHSVANALEVLATSGVLIYGFQVGSPLAPAAVTKNLQKYFKTTSHGNQPVTILKKTFTTSYLLQSGDNTLATFYVSVHPLKKGSRIEVITSLRLATDDNYHIDAAGQARDVKQLLADAVSAIPPGTAARR
ncbi:MAG TPA: hypothetical protein VJ550_14225 [Geomonas sp.]|nr:hypothetical protein [Geomonas sp.]